MVDPSSSTEPAVSPATPADGDAGPYTSAHRKPADATLAATALEHSVRTPIAGADVPLAADVAADRHRLQPKVTRYWRWRLFLSGLPVMVLLSGLAYVIPWGSGWLRWGIVGVVAAVFAVAMIFVPPIRYRVFWYAISPTEIDIQHGIIFIKRSVVPMHRVQNLQTERGPMADIYQLTNLKIKTAAGSVSISGLHRGEANDLCDRISRLSDIADDV